MQLKNESLWGGHTRSPQHLTRLQKLKEEGSTGVAARETSQTGASNTATISNRKRKASDADDADRKRSKGLAQSDDSHSSSPDDTTALPRISVGHTVQELQLPSRPATPHRTPENVPAPASGIDEDEWAAFEADIAAAEEPIIEDAIISAPAMSAADIAAKSLQESNAQRKDRQEAELEGDKEDAARKLEEEFEQMEGFEERVQRLKEKREALRLQASRESLARPATVDTKMMSPNAADADGDSEDDEEEDEDQWDGFRLR
jgi:zinc finger protein 830